jgi:Protein of unknown function (DUF3499)
MRRCARMRCSAEPIATISLRYADRLVVIGHLRPERDPGLLDLCSRHVDAMTPPVGWVVDDSRRVAFTGERG